MPQRYYSQMQFCPRSYLWLSTVYVQGVPAPKILLFRTHCTNSQRFVTFEQPANALLGWIDFSVNLDTIKQYQGYFIKLFLRITEYYPGHPATELFCYMSIIYALPNFSLLASLEGKFDKSVRISRQQIFQQLCWATVFQVQLVLAQLFDQFSQCSIMCGSFRPPHTLKMIFIFFGRALWQKTPDLCHFWKKTHEFNYLSLECSLQQPHFHAKQQKKHKCMGTTSKC